MLPALVPGDRLRVDRGAYRRRPPGVGDLVVVVDPERADRWLVKRVGELLASDRPPPDYAIAVVSDNVAAGRDSRQFGPIGAGDIVGKVYARYAPPGRRGAL